MKKIIEYLRNKICEERNGIRSIYRKSSFDIFHFKVRKREMLMNSFIIIALCEQLINEIKALGDDCKETEIEDLIFYKYLKLDEMLSETEDDHFTTHRTAGVCYSFMSEMIKIFKWRYSDVWDVAEGRDYILEKEGTLQQL